MNHIHVCLVSEQTIPNILGIYHFQPAKIIFCTTGKMEKLGKSQAIINTLKLYGLDYSGKFETVLVDQDCLEVRQNFLLILHKNTVIINSW